MPIGTKQSVHESHSGYKACWQDCWQNEQNVFLFIRKWHGSCGTMDAGNAPNNKTRHKTIMCRVNRQQRIASVSM